MKIVHTPTSEAYQLSPDTCLEVERMNLFFNEYGEQTLQTEALQYNKLQRSP